MFKKTLICLVLSNFLICANCYAQEEKIFSDAFIEKMDATYKKLEGTGSPIDPLVELTFSPKVASFIKEAFENINLLNNEISEKDWKIEDINLELSLNPKVVVTLKKK